MKSKIIKSVLRRKIDAWLATIQDETVRKMAEASVIVTGGAIASMLLKEDVNDYDIYFRDRKTVIAVSLYYIEQFRKNRPSTFKDDAERKIEFYLTDDYGRRIESVDDVAKEGANRVKIVVKSAGIVGENGANDYQYFEGIVDPESTAAGEYIDQAMQELPETDEKGEKRPEYRPVYLTSNAITLSDKIQIVLRFYGEPDKIHENYDFVHCTNYWTSWDGKLTLRPEALESLLSRELRYVGSKYPVCSIIRTRKFIKRNWTINAGQYLKMVMQVSELNLNEVAVLEDQLTGVDAAYFTQVIDAIKKKNDQVVDRAYLVELIDRIF